MQGLQSRRTREPTPRRDAGFPSSSSAAWADAGPHQQTLWLGWGSLLPPSLLRHAAQATGGNTSAKPGVLHLTAKVLF